MWLLAEHSWAADLGRAVQLADDDVGLHVVLRVRRGHRGDTTLQAAAGGTRAGLSISTVPGGQFELHAGVFDCVSAVLAEVSLTATPAYGKGR